MGEVKGTNIIQIIKMYLFFIFEFCEPPWAGTCLWLKARSWT